MKIAYLGCGCWGYCLATLLAKNGHEVRAWTTDAERAALLNRGKPHPFLPGCSHPPSLIFTTQMAEAIEGAELIVESVTSSGLRPVLKQLLTCLPKLHCPLVITSKGIEQQSGSILPEVAVSLYGEKARGLVALLSGPGFAAEIAQGLPTSVVAAAWDPFVMNIVSKAFTTATFRVYPNSDVVGVAYGGSLKNIVAIAGGIADGLRLGHGAKAALMTRGLHEIRKLAAAYGCKAETLNGLAGMGDLFLTCSSTMSRNTQFGNMIAQGMEMEKALETIGMVVEGIYTCVAAHDLAKKVNIAMPITEMVYSILYERLTPIEAVSMLMQRAIKEEHL